jgi:hypothetical protein
MASTIQSQTIGGVGDQCIALAASQFGRAHGYGDNWNTLRVAINFNVEDSGGNLSSVVLRVGLCSGTANMPGDSTTANSYGINLSLATLYRLVSTYAYYQNCAPVAFSRVGSVETTSATNINFQMSTVSNTRSMLFLDIIKGSPNYTMKAFYRNAYGAFDSTPAVFLAAVGHATPSATSHTYVSPTGTALAINTGTNGILDTVYVGWNLLTPRLFISNLAVVKLA